MVMTNVTGVPNAERFAELRLGLDLSDSFEGAGGIGGLVMITDHGTGSRHFPAYDGNGNVTALVTDNGDVSARYEYSPFGELLRASGPFAGENPFRWSTKLWDKESGLSYYGYRYYSATLGRWINEDPIEETDLRNLYLFLRNSPQNLFNLFGMEGSSGEQGAAVGAGSVVASSGAATAIGFLTRVKTAVEVYSDFQEFTFAIMDAAEGDSDDLLILFLEQGGRILEDRLRGGGAGRALKSAVYEMHHIFPKRFNKAFEAAGVAWDKFKVRLRRQAHRGVHQNGAKGGRLERGLGSVSGREPECYWFPNERLRH